MLHDIYDGIAATPRLSVDDTGNVGIGTPNPEHKLDVNGNIRASCYFDRNDINYYLNPNGDSRLANTYLNYIRNYGNLHVDGNVGIGTASPGYKLDVNGIGRYNGSVYIEGGNFLRIWGSGASPGNATLQYMGSGDGAYVRLEAGDSAAWRPVALAPSGGNVGIGTASPGYKLDVNGNAIVRDRLNLSGGDCRIQAIAPYYPFLALYSDQYPYVPDPYKRYVTFLAYPPGGFMMANSGDTTPDIHIDANGNLYRKGVCAQVSDDRIKFNEQKLEYGLAQVMALEPKRYDRMEWGFDPETEEIIFYPENIFKTNEIGLVAQEVQQVIPEAVSIPEDENRDLWKISYDTIIPVLVKAIQEQQVQIDALKKEIQALKPGT